MEQTQTTKKKVKIGTIVFYSLYFLGVAAALAAIFSVMAPLRSWLETYQASQPENKSQQIFTQLFAQPDWEALYTMAGVEDTDFEGAASYRVYMEQTVGTGSLTYMETSAGLSGDRKYIIRHGNEKIASFTMTGTEDEKTHITTWELDKLELFFTREQHVAVETAVGQTVYINGVALNSSHTVKTVCTRAEDYLPEGVHGYRTQRQEVEGLLTAPTVTVKNADGTEAAVIQDETGCYLSLPELPQISEAEEKIAIAAAKAKALYAIRAINTRELRKHFDSKSQPYKDICSIAVFMLNYTGYRFDNSATVVSDYYRYNDDLFSAHVVLKLKVTRETGTIKDYDAATTFFFTRQENGEYRVTDMTNLRIQERREQVRLTFMTEAPSSIMVDTEEAHLTFPQVTAPEGQQLRGWAIRETDEAGRTVMTILFTPDENGNVYPAAPLESMTLYPIFEGK